MIEKLLKNTYLMFHKVKVIHSIPGRIRVFVPFLSDIPENFKKYEDYVKDVIKLKKGINLVEYSYLTNKILIEYDKNKLNEKEIINWINKISNIIIDNDHLYKDMTVEEIEKNIKNFYIILKEKLEK